MVKNLPASAEDIKDAGSIPGLGRFPGEGNGNALQYSCLGNSMDRGAWQATVHGVSKEWDMTQRLNNTFQTNLSQINTLPAIQLDKEPGHPTHEAALLESPG